MFLLSQLFTRERTINNKPNDASLSMNKPIFCIIKAAIKKKYDGAKQPVQCKKPAQTWVVFLLEGIELPRIRVRTVAAKLVHQGQPVCTVLEEPEGETR